MLLWGDDRGIVRQRLEPNAEPELIAQPAWVLQGLTVADGFVYWVRLEQEERCRVLRRPLDAPAIELLAEPG